MHTRSAQHELSMLVADTQFSVVCVCSRLCDHHPDWDIEHSGTSEHLLVPLSNRFSLHPHLQRAVILTSITIGGFCLVLNLI